MDVVRQNFGTEPPVLVKVFVPNQEHFVCAYYSITGKKLICYMTKASLPVLWYIIAIDRVDTG